MPGRVGPEVSSAAAAARAASLAVGATLSSRSRMTASAADARALATLRSESAGAKEGIAQFHGCVPSVIFFNPIVRTRGERLRHNSTAA